MTVGELNVIIGAKMDSLDRDLKRLDGKMERASQNTERSWGKAFTRISTLAAGAFSVSIVANYAKEAVALAGKLEGVEAAYKRLNNPQLLSKLRYATRGTVSDLELMQQAVRAQNFKVPLDQLATYFEFATKRAAQTGESVDYLVNSIIDGIGRKSTLVLDNLGISATELQDEIQKTGDFGAAAGNIIQRELEKAGDVALTTAQKTAQLNAELENQKAIIGKQLVPVYNEFLNIASGVIEYLSQLFDTSLSLRERLALLNPTTAATALVMNRAKKAAEESAEAFNAQADAIKRVNTAMQASRSQEATLSLASKGIPSLAGMGANLQIINPEAAAQGAKMLADVNDQLGQGIINADMLGDTLSNAFFTNIAAAESFGEAMGQMVRQLVAELVRLIAKLVIIRGIMAFIPGANMATAGKGLLAGLFGGFRAAGGPVIGGRSYIVGERGPELFTPGATGSITPNHKIGGGMVASVAISGRLMGRDWILANERNEYTQKRIRGF